MKHLKLYLDTSVISYLDQKDSPEKMADTLLLWQEIAKGKFDVLISKVTVDEINDNLPGKRELLLAYLAQIEFSVVGITEEMKSIVDQIVEHGILSQKSIDSCYHIAAAIVNECDYIVSWNFRQMVNIKTINGVKAIACLRGLRTVGIVEPAMLVEEED